MSRPPALPVPAASAAALAAGGAMIALDALWLGWLASDFYKGELGAIMADKPRWYAAGVFYPLYIAGLTVFVIAPALRRDEGALKAAPRAAFFGLVAYGTYDLTNLATLRAFSPVVAVVDMAWGVVVTTAAACLGVAAARIRRP